MRRFLYKNSLKCWKKCFFVGTNNWNIHIITIYLICYNFSTFFLIFAREYIVTFKCLEVVGNTMLTFFSSHLAIDVTHVSWNLQNKFYVKKYAILIARGIHLRHLRGLSRYTTSGWLYFESFNRNVVPFFPFFGQNKIILIFLFMFQKIFIFFY